ncbi:hypothetical protein COLO4_08673 [Corchorus olitorius]|uniref:Uncharacterized protein n=1 Tax=Corchorus olitorius TaxID=93759 RepID=A0A1R3KEX3_9ROSI|nr:hypothetical protein COLO4_08673 [Corchorus olitorius]
MEAALQVGSAAPRSCQGGLPASGHPQKLSLRSGPPRVRQGTLAVRIKP